MYWLFRDGLVTFALSTSAGKEVGAKSATHDLIKLLDNKLVPIDFLDLALSLANSSSTTKSRGVSLHSHRVLDYCR